MVPILDHCYPKMPSFGLSLHSSGMPHCLASKLGLAKFNVLDNYLLRK